MKDSRAQAEENRQTIISKASHLSRGHGPHGAGFLRDSLRKAFNAEDPRKKWCRP
jgi:hypothetical protein